MKRSSQGPALFEQWECQGLPGLPFEPETARPTGQPEARSSILSDPEKPILAEMAEKSDSGPVYINARDASKMFEGHLRRMGYPYVSVTEARKAVFAGGDLSAFDYMVYSSTGANHLVYVLGGGKTPTGHHRDMMDEWERIFGQGFEVRFVRWGASGWESRTLNDRTWTEYRVENEEPEQH